MTIEQMKEIQEANKPKYLLTYEYVNDNGEWEQAKTTCLTLEETNMKLKAIEKSDRFRKGDWVKLD